MLRIALILLLVELLGIIIFIEILVVILILGLAHGLFVIWAEHSIHANVSTFVAVFSSNTGKC